MLFNLINIPATFQSYMNEIVCEYLDEFYIIYLNNILIYSNALKEYMEHVRKVLKRL